MTSLLMLAVLAAPPLLLLIKYPEVGIALTLIAKPELTGLLTNFIGDTPIKSLLFNGYIALGILLFLVKEQKLKALVNPVLFTAIVLGIWLFYGVTYTISMSNGLAKAQRYVIENLPMALIAVAFYRNPERFERCLRWLAVLGWFLLAVAILRPPVYEIGSRLAPGYYVSIQYGRIVAISVIASLSLYLLYKNSKLWHFSYIAYVPVGSILVLLSGSRGPLVALLVALAVLLWLYSLRTNLTRLAIPLVLLGALVVMTGWLAVSQLPSALVERLMPSNTQFFAESLFERRYRYEKSIDIFIQSPLTGQGTGSFEWSVATIYAADVFDADYAHNIFLELLSENGLIGLTIFLLLLFTGTAGVFRILFPSNKAQAAMKASPAAQKVQTHLIAMFVILCLTFVTTLFSFDIAGNSILWFCLAAVCVLKLTYQQELNSARVYKFAPVPLASKASVYPSRLGSPSRSLGRTQGHREDFALSMVGKERSL